MCQRRLQTTRRLAKLPAVFVKVSLAVSAVTSQASTCSRVNLSGQSIIHAGEIKVSVLVKRLFSDV